MLGDVIEEFGFGFVARICEVCREKAIHCVSFKRPVRD
jgi:hypothetical protein